MWNSSTEWGIPSKLSLLNIGRGKEHGGGILIVRIGCLVYVDRGNRRSTKMLRNLNWNVDLKSLN